MLVIINIIRLLATISNNGIKELLYNELINKLENINYDILESAFLKAEKLIHFNELLTDYRIILAEIEDYLNKA